MPSQKQPTEKGAVELVSSGGLTQLFQLLQHRHATILDPNVTTEQLESAMEVLDPLTVVLESIGENGDKNWEEYIALRNG